MASQPDLSAHFLKSKKRFEVLRIETVPRPIPDTITDLLGTLSCWGLWKFGGLLWVTCLFLYWYAHRCTWQLDQAWVSFLSCFPSCFGGLHLIHQARLTGVCTCVHTTVYKHINKYTIHNQPLKSPTSVGLRLQMSARPLAWVPGIKLRPYVLYSKHITGRAISPASVFPLHRVKSFQPNVC